MGSDQTLALPPDAVSESRADSVVEARASRPSLAARRNDVDAASLSPSVSYRNLRAGAETVAPEPIFGADRCAREHGAVSARPPERTTVAGNRKRSYRESALRADDDRLKIIDLVGQRDGLRLPGLGLPNVG